MDDSKQQAGRPIAVYGEALVDDFGDHKVLGGAPFNVAPHLAAFGQAVLMLTRVGDDANGGRVRDECARFGMGLDGVQVDAQLPTGRVLVERSADGSFVEAPPASAPGALVDTVGAGDAFSAVFLLGRARGRALAQTLVRAHE